MNERRTRRFRSRFRYIDHAPGSPRSLDILPGFSRSGASRAPAPPARARPEPPGAGDVAAGEHLPVRPGRLTGAAPPGTTTDVTPHEPSPASVFWQRCAAAPGCRGRAAEPYGGCPAHLSPREFERFVDALRPGAEIDLRGVTVPSWLLEAVLDAVTGPDGRPHLGRTRFDGAVLPSAASLRGFCVEGDSSFDGACFLGFTSFHDARFFGNASFRDARFGQDVSFRGARFHRHASFEEAAFTGEVTFAEATWHADASFRHTVFMAPVSFDHAGFGRDAAMQAACFGEPVCFEHVQVMRHARLERTRFRHGLAIGPMVTGGGLGLEGAIVHGGAHIHAAAQRVTAR